MLYSIGTLVILMVTFAQSAKWNYEDRGQNVTHWKDHFAECGFARQSPIDVPMHSGASCKKPLELEWTSHNSHYAIRNSGHSLKAIPFVIDHSGGADVSGLEVLHHTNDTNIKLTNKFFGTYRSEVNREYCFDSLHFHWGRHEGEGSEHTINGKAYPLEVHLVHYSCDYRVAGEALREYASGDAARRYDDQNVLAVIGVMFEIGEPNPVLAKILDEVIIDGIFENKAGLEESPNFLELYYTEFDVAGLLPQSREMVSYLGSLTTPPCYETVRWHLLREHMTVSEEQMVAFRRLLEGTDPTQRQAPNFRPPQPRNQRMVWSCQEHIDAMMLEDGEEVVSVIVRESEEDRAWKHAAIALIALFAAVILVCSFVLCYLCRAHRKMSDVQNGVKASYDDAAEDAINDDQPRERDQTV